MTGLVVLAIIGGTILFVSAIWITIIAYQESTSCILLSIFIPFYDLYYLVTRWDKTKRPFIIGLIGFVALVGGIVPTFMQTKADLEPVVAEFMEAGAVLDVDTAYLYLDFPYQTGCIGIFLW